MKIENYKTICCESSWYRKSRANYRCSQCGKDVTMELLFIYQSLELDKKIKAKKNEI